MPRLEAYLKAWDPKASVTGTIKLGGLTYTVRCRDVARWLIEYWQQIGRLLESHVVRLPGENEWEKAARGGIDIPREPIVRAKFELSDRVVLMQNPQPQRRYPWGNEVDPAIANYGDTAIRATNGVHAKGDTVGEISPPSS